jgi:hypothetical protein
MCVRLSGVAKQASLIPIALSPSLTYTCADLERLTPYVRELSRKQYVTAQSLEKIEDGK